MCDGLEDPAGSSPCRKRSLQLVSANAMVLCSSGEGPAHCRDKQSYAPWCGYGKHAVLPQCRNLSDRSSAKAELLKAIAECLNTAGRCPKDVCTVCIGTAGVDLPEDIAYIQNVLKTELHDGVELILHSDAVLALASGTGGILHGCVLIAGNATGLCELGHNKPTSCVVHEKFSAHTRNARSKHGLMQ